MKMYMLEIVTKPILFNEFEVLGGIKEQRDENERGLQAQGEYNFLPFPMAHF